MSFGDDSMNNQTRDMQEAGKSPLAGGGHTSRLWLFAAALAMVAAWLVVDVGFAVARATTDPAVGGKVLAVAGRLTSDTNGLFLVDLDNETILVYQYSSDKNRLRFSAARTFAYDRRLEDYSTSPSPEQIRGMVDRADGVGNAEGEK